MNVLLPLRRCPDNACLEWGCDCFDPKSMSGNTSASTSSRPYGLQASTDAASGDVICPSTCPGDTSVVQHDDQQDENVCCQEEDGPLQGKICLEWDTSVVSTHPNVTSLSWDQCLAVHGIDTCIDALYFGRTRQPPFEMYNPPSPYCTQFLHERTADCGIQECCHKAQHVSSRRAADPENGSAQGDPSSEDGEFVPRRKLLVDENTDECGGEPDFVVRASESTQHVDHLNDIAVSLFYKDAQPAFRTPSHVVLSGFPGSGTPTQIVSVTTNQARTCSVDSDCNYFLSMTTANGFDLSGCNNWEAYQCVRAETCTSTRVEGALMCGMAEIFLASVAPGQGVCVQSKVDTFCSYHPDYSTRGQFFKQDGSYCVFGHKYRVCPSSAQASWNRESATLQVPINIDGSYSYPAEQLHMKFSLLNRRAAQPAVAVTATLCNVTRASPTTVFSSNVWHITAAGPPVRLQAVQGDTEELVSTAQVSPGGLPPGGSLEIALDRASGMDALSGRFPASAEVVARANSVLTATVRGEEGFTGAAHFRIALDHELVRRAGGCATAGALELCLEGHVQAYHYDASAQEWLDMPFELHGTNALVNVTQKTIFTILARPRCCEGRTCGDRSTHAGKCPAQGNGAVGTIALLGSDGTVTMRPTLTPSTRPSERVTFSATASATAPASPYVVSGQWKQFCPQGEESCERAVDDASWISSRMQHTMAAVSASKFLIYGGIGCGKYVVEEGERVCVQGSMVPLNDLWEFDLTKARAGFGGFRQLDMSPSLGGLIGASIARAGLSDHRMIVLGGSKSRNFAFESWSALPMNPTQPQGMLVRELLFNQRKASEVELLSAGELSFHSVACNRTHAVLFGGFVRNAQSAATYVYVLGSPSLQTALSSQNILARGPNKRGFSVLVKLEYIKGDTISMFGGYKNNEGMSDLWILDLRTGTWTMVHENNPGGDRGISDVALNSILLIQGTYLMSLGGLRGGYKPGISFRPGYSPGEMYQATDNELFWSRKLDSEYSKWWGEMVTVYPTTCCGDESAYKDECISAGFGTTKGCTFAPRAMHSAIGGKFGLASTEGFVVYGGVGQDGKALLDHWLVWLDVAGHDMSNQEDVYDGVMSSAVHMKMYLENIAADAFNEAVEDFKNILRCPELVVDNTWIMPLYETTYTCGSFEHLKIFNLKAVDTFTETGAPVLQISFSVWV